MGEDLNELSTDELIERIDRGESLIEDGDDLEVIESLPRELEEVTVELLEQDVEYLRGLSEEWGLELSKLIRVAVRNYVIDVRDERDSENDPR